MGLPLEVTLIPDLTELKKAKGKISQSVGGKGGAGGTAGAVAGGGAGGGIMGILGGILAGIAKIAVIVTIIGAIVGSFLDLKPIRAILDMIMKILSIVLLPFGLIIFALLKPFLIFMIRLMPYWLQFMTAFVEEFNKVGDLLGMIGDYILGVIDTIMNSFGGAKSIGKDVAQAVTDPSAFVQRKAKEFTEGYGKTFTFNIGGIDITDSSAITKLGNALYDKVTQYGMG